jgi:hypothetical protein
MTNRIFSLDDQTNFFPGEPSKFSALDNKANFLPWGSKQIFALKK